MARTFIRQDTQIRRSDVYDDTIAPSLANFETNPVNIEQDLNNLRSQVSNLLEEQVGNWYDDLVTPSALDTGTQRGVNSLNEDLHAVERKRVLVGAISLADVVVGIGATGTLTATGNFGNTETVTLGTKTYTFQTTLTNVDGNVLIGATASDSLDNLIAAINLAAGAGTLYAAATTLNADAYAAAGAGDTMLATAKIPPGNSIATTETAANASWGGATLSGGTTTANVAILGLNQLPPNTVAAVGAVTTLGTVVAAHGGTFGAHSLTEVSGATAISPKNMVEVVSGDSRDPILSSGRRIYALLHGESGLADGDTITVGTDNRVQVSFVRITAAGDDLEAVPSADIGGQEVNLVFTERKALLTLTEQDFLLGAVVDVPANATVTRQVAYDNQGTTPVDLTTNATLDLEGAGLVWAIRDDAEANLFRVIEGSAGGTSQVSIDSDVDTFNVDAAVSDFDQGIRVDTGGTRINVGETAGTIETTGAADLRILGAGELYLDDGNQTGSTWSQTNGIKLSDTTAEWDNFETAFGEVSLLNAIYQAANPGNQRLAKTFANVTSTTSADTDVGGVGGGTNLDAQLPDMSTGTFLSDYDVFLNGNLLRPGANSGANNDYYPGTSLANGQLRFEFNVKINDVLCVIAYS